MKLRTRVLGGTVLLVLIPLLVLALLIRREMTGRLTDQYTRRVDALIEVIETDLRETGEDLERRSAILKNTFADDNRIRRYLLDGQEALRPYVLDWAARAMTLAGLDLLQVQDATGRIVSSGHFRNEYDRVDREIVSGLVALGRPALVRARRPEAPFLALARVDSLRLGADRYTLVAGVEIDRGLLARLSPGGDPVVSLLHPGGALSPDPALEARLAADGIPQSGEMLVRAIRLPGEGAHLLATHSLAPRRELLRSLDRWLLAAGLLAAAGSVWLAARLSARISRPMEELARKTDALDLDRLDADFSSDRTDEIGTLSRFLGRMTARLRASVVRLKEAERRATVGELARQVNHDLRNAFTPLRNVVRHLTDVARDEPDQLGRVYAERRDTLESGLGYLEDLAANWRKMSRRPERVPCDLADIVKQVASGRLPGDGGPVRLELRAEPARVLADPVGLRRVVENLVANACESLDSEPGVVEIALDRVEIDAGVAAVRLTVRDDGGGMAPESLERIFDDFYTTKPGGSGLGLTVVRRLVSDFEGTVRVESRPGAGSTFEVVLPAATSSERESAE